MTRMEFERRRQRWTQVDLGYLTKVPNTNISRYERGWATPYPSEAVRLARVLRIPIAELLAPVEIERTGDA